MQVLLFSLLFFNKQHGVMKVRAQNSNQFLMAPCSSVGIVQAQNQVIGLTFQLP